MLTRANRLRSRRDLVRVRASRRVFRTTRLTIRVVNQVNGGPPRAAVVASRRVSPLAVKRNRVARWLREAFRLTLPNLRHGVDVLLVPHAPASSYTWQRIQKDLQDLLEQAGLLKKEEPGPEA